MYKGMGEKFQSEFNVFGWFPSLQNLDVFFGIFTAEQNLKSFLGRNNSLERVFRFSNSLPYGLEESRVVENLDQLGFWLIGKFKNAKKICQYFFFSFLSRHYGFTNYFEILIFAFSNIIPRGVATSKILPSQDQYFQKYKALESYKFTLKPQF